jgi:uncharacterized coiled-coil DUF342 family protein
MELDNKITKTVILKEIDNLKNYHESLKFQIIELTKQIDEIENTINNKLVELEQIEKDYVELVEILNNDEL